MISGVSLRPDVMRRSAALQTRILSAPLFIEMSPRELFQEVRRHLSRASSDGRLRDSMAHIHAHLRFDEREGGFTIYGARLERANFHRTRAAPHFTRDDGAWFDFLITGRSETRTKVEVLAYSCEVRLPDELAALPRFVRFDLNPPGHANENPGLRCHIHPGHDDLQAVAPLMHPLDIIDFCLFGLTWPEKLRGS